MNPFTVRGEPIPPSPLAGDRLAKLAQAVRVIRGAGDSATASSSGGLPAPEVLGASELRLLRVDAHSRSLQLLEVSGEEVPYRAEEGGPVERVVRQERALFDEGQEAGPVDIRLWSRPPGSIAALPLFSGTELSGCLLLGYPAPRTFDPDERLVLQILADTVALALGRGDLKQLLEDERARRADVERRLEADEETSSNLMSVVAHEIRAPLTAIKAYTESLIDTLDNPHTPRERFLNIINQECDRLGRLVGDILDLSRLEAGHRPLRLARFDPDALAREVIGHLQPLASARQLALSVEIEPGLVVEADTDLVRRLLVNLLGNAIKFSPVGGRVWVRMCPQGDQWTGTVEDEGPGVAPEELARVFERFYRGARPEAQQTDGAGLGLAISRGIVELHGGRIWAEPRSGGGARFCFAMPLRQMASVEARGLARRVLERRDLRELLDRTVEMIAALMDAEIVSLMLVDPDRGDLFVAASRGFEDKSVSLRRTLVRSGVAGSVAARGRPVLVNNIETDRRFQRINHPQYHTKSLLSVPLRVESQTLGVINVNNRASRQAFDENDLAVLAVLVEHVGGAVERAFAHPDGSRMAEEASEAIQGITRLKRAGLVANRGSVRMARAVARELGMGPAEHDVVAYAAAVRDIGMSSIRERLMGVRGPLDADEHHTLMQHPEAGAEMIRPLEPLGTVCDLVLSHHERWDGAGYPRGLKGSEIPLGARILAVVDAYESMTAGRPYRTTCTLDQAIAELRRGAGNQFDPEVVETLVRLLENESGSHG
ncbi:MAG TPA: HD domain-containing phosphohydrolase [Candidatus Eisenbacteria bacterium]|jgi:signal transduction histidine kinase/HD-GYP domain-containing protein (c-di-GMP phosphodiesterase class II)